MELDDPIPQYGGYRQPTQSELNFFKSNTNVGGYAAPDNKIVMNPYSNLTDREKRLVGLNEGARLFMRDNPSMVGNFGLTKEQERNFANYSDNIEDKRATILARILTGDPSVGNPTIRQKFNANKIKNALSNGLGRYGQGNIDLYNRPIIKNDDGTISTVKSYGFTDENGKHILIPTVTPEGIVSNDEAIKRYYQTGEYLGKFDTIPELEDYATRLHNEQDRYYSKIRKALTQGGGY